MGKAEKEEDWMGKGMGHRKERGGLSVQRRFQSGSGRKGMSVFGGDRGHEQAGTNFPRRGEFVGAGDEYLTGFL